MSLYKARIAAATGGVLAAIIFVLGAARGALSVWIHRGQAVGMEGPIALSFVAYVTAGAVAGGIIVFGVAWFRSALSKYLCAAAGGALAFLIIAAGLPDPTRTSTGFAAVYGAALGAFGLFMARRADR